MQRVERGGKALTPSDKLRRSSTVLAWRGTGHNQQLLYQQENIFTLQQ